MSVATEISRIQTDRNTIRNALIEWGQAQSTDNLDVLAATIASLQNRGAVDAEVQEGQTYTIPQGYHNGSGTVRGVAGGGNYQLQAKSVTPTKNEQNVTPPLTCWPTRSLLIPRARLSPVQFPSTVRLPPPSIRCRNPAWRLRLAIPAAAR